MVQPPFQAQYATTDLPSGVTPTGSETAEFIQSGVSVQISVTQIRTATSSPINTSTGTVGSLPSAAAAGAGARSFVTDATVTTFASTVAGGGSNAVPVYSDGTNWRIG